MRAIGRLLTPPLPAVAPVLRPCEGPFGSIIPFLSPPARGPLHPRNRTFGADVAPSAGIALNSGRRLAGCGTGILCQMRKSAASTGQARGRVEKRDLYAHVMFATEPYFAGNVWVYLRRLTCS